MVSLGSEQPNVESPTRLTKAAFALQPPRSDMKINGFIRQKKVSSFREWGYKRSN